MSLQSAEISDINTTRPTEANAGAVQVDRFRANALVAVFARDAADLGDLPNHPSGKKPPRFPKAVFVIRTAWRRLVTSMTFVPDRK